jgi:hypothetical protein
MLSKMAGACDGKPMFFRAGRAGLELKLNQDAVRRFAYASSRTASSASVHEVLLRTIQA